MRNVTGMKDPVCRTCGERHKFGPCPQVGDQKLSAAKVAPVRLPVSREVVMVPAPPMPFNPSPALFVCPVCKERHDRDAARAKRYRDKKREGR
jgi:hypothetical protein